MGVTPPEPTDMLARVSAINALVRSIHEARVAFAAAARQYARTRLRVSTLFALAMK